MQNAKTTEHPILRPIPVVKQMLILTAHPGFLAQFDAIPAVTLRFTLAKNRACCRLSESPWLM